MLGISKKERVLKHILTNHAEVRLTATHFKNLLEIEGTKLWEKKG